MFVIVWRGSPRSARRSATGKRTSACSSSLRCHPCVVQLVYCVSLACPYIYIYISIHNLSVRPPMPSRSSVVSLDMYHYITYCNHVYYIISHYCKSNYYNTHHYIAYCNHVYHIIQISSGLRCRLGAAS